MTDKRQESPVKQAPISLAFRFRANEEELEELSIEEEKQEEQSSIQENFSKLFDQLPRKLLTKNHSQSDSEDTSESSKLSEWWKESDEFRSQRIESIVGALETDYSVGRKVAASSVPDIKVTQGRTAMKEVQGEIESGVEAGEELTASMTYATASVLDTLKSSAGHPQSPPPGNLDPDPPPSRMTSHANVTNALKGVLTYCVPIVIAAWFSISEFWFGVLFGVCFIGLAKVLWQLIEAVLTGESDEPEKGPFKLPQYKLLPPLKSPSVPLDKRGCFNVYTVPYDPDTYTVSQTRPVCLELEGSLLRITRVRTKLAKRAHFSQPDYELDHCKKAEYDLSRCTVQLLPEGLARKRWYSKKYPIAVNLGEGAILGAGDERFHAGYEVAFYSASEKEDSEDSDTEGGGGPNSCQIKLASPVLYLFSRCDRDKEDWYRRLLAVAAPSLDETNLAVEPEEADQSTATDKSEEKESQTAEEPSLSVMEEYLLSLSKFVDMPPDLMGNSLLQGESDMEIDVDCLEVQWLNAFIGRILFDMFRSPFWLSKIQEKLQKKLSALKRPEYVNEMEITEMELGREGPTIHRISRPVVDERGLWFDLDISYKGTMYCTIQTKLNLLRAQQRDGLKVEEDTVIADKMKSPVFDSEMEDTAESSTDDDEDDKPSNTTAALIPEPDTHSSPSKTKKKVKTSSNFLRFVENVAKSKAFQHVAQTKMIQKVIEGVSQTKLQLRVQVDGIVGTMAVNIPPPPSDRLWYGFRGMPKIWLKAKPLVGEWNVKFSQVTNWIEKKLIKEFQKLLIIPNMDDLILPMNPSVVSDRRSPTPS